MDAVDQLPDPPFPVHVAFPTGAAGDGFAPPRAKMDEHNAAMACRRNSFKVENRIVNENLLGRCEVCTECADAQVVGRV